MITPLNSTESQSHPTYVEITQTFPPSSYLVKCECELLTFFVAAWKNVPF